MFCLPHLVSAFEVVVEGVIATRFDEVVFGE
jgi:hypothetical protein